MVEVRAVKGKKGIRDFINVEWHIYKGDSKWVPPLISETKKTLSGKHNPVLRGPHVFYIAYKDGKPAGRVLAGINTVLNEKKSKKEGFISLFESINDRETASLLFENVEKWMREQGMECIVGPVSITNADEDRGVLVKGFDGPPVLKNAYNYPYYESLFLENGYEKHMDLFAFLFDSENLPIERFGRVVEYSMKKFNFHIDSLNMSDIDGEIKDIKDILDRSMPESWEHIAPLTLEDIRDVFYSIKNLLDPDLVNLARNNDNVPIGFVLALPDYNQVLKKLNGRLLPLGVLKFLWYRRKINGMRILMQFVVPEYRNKAVNSAIFYKLMLMGKKKGYVYGEGSTIAEMNIESIRSVKGAGSKHYRTYRIYRKDLVSNG